MVEGESTVDRNLRNCVNAMPLPSDGGFHPTVSATAPQGTAASPDDIFAQLLKRARKNETQ
jgi:hypothetical protein